MKDFSYYLFHHILSDLQLTSLHAQYDLLQLKYGDPNFQTIYGAGCIANPQHCLIFMNPTARNLSASKSRIGLRAPRIGLKQTWKMFYILWLLEESLHEQIQKSVAEDRTYEFVDNLYQQVTQQSLFISNLAKCTQVDAKPMSDSVFKEYLPLFREEMKLVGARNIITFGNQVSSIVCQKKICVSDYSKNEFEEIEKDWIHYKVYPCYYPVGMGYRNINKAIERIQCLSDWLYCISRKS